MNTQVRDTGRLSGGSCNLLAHRTGRGPAALAPRGSHLPVCGVRDLARSVHRAQRERLDERDIAQLNIADRDGASAALLLGLRSAPV
jgi:hypothetical protein